MLVDTLKGWCLCPDAPSPPLVGQLAVCGLAGLGRDEFQFYLCAVTNP